MRVLSVLQIIRKKVSNPQKFFSFKHASEQLDNVSFVREAILEALDQFSPNSSAGPEKKCKRSLAEPFEILFKNFLQCGKIQSILKEAFVVPVHQGGARSTPGNFRPVSLITHVIKSLQSFSHLENPGKPSRSTVQPSMVSEATDLACLNFLNTMTQSLDSWRMEKMFKVSTLTLEMYFLIS
jgi:hypothetical protein